MTDYIPDRTFAFTVKYEGIVNVLSSEAKISRAFNPQTTPQKDHPPLETFNAIWDTGATHTAISHQVVAKCNLRPIGMTNVSTASGITTAPVYYINIILPNNVAFSQIRVTEGKMGKNADVLIGMDIMRIGDFAVTNHNGKTVFSFKVPSTELIDFVNKNQPSNPPAKRATPKVGRNTPCPCGSGKKYKKCCGK
jgi:predicted aspartyl protease